ncbi:MAG: hypothetical protein Q9217_000942 [Psora testacea]
MAHQYPQDGKKDYSLRNAYNPPTAPLPYEDYPAAAPHGFYGQPAPHQSYAQTPSSARILHIYHEGMMSRYSRIVDCDKRTPLYMVEVHCISRPHVIVRSASNPDTLVGTAKFRKISLGIDVVVHGHPITLEPRGIFKSGHKYRSPAANGAQRYWKSEGVFSGGDMICLDENEMPVARFDVSNWSVRKKGKLELVGHGVTENGLGMDETVMAGVALMELRKRRNGNSGGVDGG